MRPTSGKCSGCVALAALGEKKQINGILKEDKEAATPLSASGMTVSTLKVLIVQSGSPFQGNHHG